MKVTLLIVLLLGVSSATLAQGKYGHLKSWANEYPLNFRTTPKRNVFALPEIRQPLLKMLGPQNFKRMMNAFGQATLIDVIDGYLIIKGNSEPHTTPLAEQERVTVAVNLNDKEGSIYVIFSGLDESSRNELYCTKGTNCSYIFIAARIRCR